MVTSHPAEQVERLADPFAKREKQHSSDHLMFAWSFDEEEDGGMERVSMKVVDEQAEAAAQEIHREEGPPETYLG